MNFAHAIGEHNFSSSGEALSHMLVNLAPLGFIIVGILVITTIVKRPVPQEIVAKIRRK